MTACSGGSSTPETETPGVEQAQPQESVPEPASDWGDGSLRGIVRLDWGAPAPEGSTLQLTLWKGGDRIQQHDIPATGPGPWAFEFKADDPSSFKPEDLFGIGAMIVVPPDGEAWYMSKPATVQIWKHGEASGPIEVPMVSIDPRVAGEGDPPF